MHCKRKLLAVGTVLLVGVASLKIVVIAGGIGDSTDSGNSFVNARDFEYTQMSSYVQPVMVSNNVGIDALKMVERSPMIEEIDFSNQQVIFNPEDFQEPVEFDDCHVTTYCNCEKCCGVYAWEHTTATGAETTEGITIAVDPKVIPYGSIVELDGHFYIAQDCGGAIDGVEVDVYVEDTGGKHTNCYAFMRELGQDYVGIKVWMPK